MMVFGDNHARYLLKTRPPTSPLEQRVEGLVQLSRLFFAALTSSRTATPRRSGAATRNRTLDLLITSELLYRLSYGGQNGSGILKNAIALCNDKASECKPSPLDQKYRLSHRRFDHQTARKDTSPT
jgi:hypothetical protein